MILGKIRMLWLRIKHLLQLAVVLTVWLSGAILIGGFFIRGYYLHVFHRPDVPLASNKITLEYGESVKLNPKNLLETKYPDIKNSTQLDLSSLIFQPAKTYPEVGSYSLKVSYTQKRKLQTKFLNFVVADTKPPEFTELNNGVIELEVGAPKPDFGDQFKASDFSEFTIEIDDSAIDYQKAGDYQLKITARDKYKNEVEKTAKIKIISPAPKFSGGIYYSPAQNSVANLTIVRGLIIANKKHALPSNYAPGEDATAGAAIRQLIAEMQALGYNVSNSYSGYRSYSYQAGLYNSYVANYGQASADTFSARPGHSEHQTGLTFDLLFRSGSLINSGAEVGWIATNAHRFGFIVRYQSGKEWLTGYTSEPWHLRYVGSAHAEAIYSAGLTLEEYLGVPGGDYY